MRFRLGFWNRLYVVFAGVTLIAAPIAMVYQRDHEVNEGNRLWIAFCEKTHLAKPVSDFENYEKCTDLTLKPGSFNVGQIMLETAEVAVILLAALWLLLRIAVALARWVKAGRRPVGG